jgi:hypothetical protein
MLGDVCNEMNVNRNITTQGGMIMQTTGIDLLLRAIDVSLDRRKLTLAVVGLVVSGVIGGIFFGLAVSVDNVVAAALLALLGLIAVWVITILFTEAISKMSYESLVGRPPLTMGEALRYAANHLTSLLFAPLLLAAMILAVYIAEAIVLLLGRIPTAGPILTSLLFLPLVLINMFLLVFVFFGAWLVPAIVAGEGTGVMETLSRLRTIVRQAPGRIATYWVMTIFLTVTLGLVLLTVMSVAITQTDALSAIASGGSPTSIIGFVVGSPIDYLLGPFSGIGRGMEVAALLYMLALLLLGVVVVAIPYFIFPLACACAAHISMLGGAPAAMPVPRPVPAPPPARVPMPAATPVAQPTPAQPPVQAPAQPAPAAPSYCKQCGAPLRPGAGFCGQCGARVS